LTLDPESQMCVKQGEPFILYVNAFLSTLSNDDVIVECIISDHESKDISENCIITQLSAHGEFEGGNQTYRLECNAKMAGQKYIKVRIYPYHKLLCHKFELGCMTWVES